MQIEKVARIPVANEINTPLHRINAQIVAEVMEEKRESIKHEQFHSIYL